MDTGPRVVFRTALVLVLLAGAGLVVYSTIGKKPPAPGAGPLRIDTAHTLASGPRVAQPPPAPPPTPSAPVATPPAPAGSGDGPPSADAPQARPVEVNVGPFKTAFRNEQTGREEAVITGDRGLPGESSVYVFKPVVDLMSLVGDVGAVDVKTRNVRVTAQHCELFSDPQSFRLSDNVVAQGEDFKVMAQSVSYTAKERILTSDDPVHIEGQRKGEKGAVTATMVVEGKGLFVDVTVSDMSVLRDVDARLLDVAEDFLATRAEPQAGAPPEKREVRITCDGRMDYGRVDQRVTFHDSVLAVSAGKTLACDELTVVLGKTEGMKAQIERVKAVGKVQLKGKDQIVRGDVLTWQNVTQTGTVAGKPDAIVSTPDFELAGRELTLYNFSQRVHTEGEGRLYWKAALKQPEPATAPETPRAFDLGPLGLTSSDPVTVQWQRTMTMDREAGRADFTGAVSAIQTGLKLDCDQLVLTFAPDRSGLGSVQADGHVTLHDKASTPERDVHCERMTWDAAHDTVEMTAPERGIVTVVSGRNEISSSHVALDSRAGTLACRAPGKLTATARPGDNAGGGEQAPPLTVEWQKDMDFHEKPTPEANFRGQVIAVRGTQRFRGESLKVEFDADTNPLKAIVAGGAVIDLRTAGQSPVEAPGPTASSANDWHLEADTVTVLPPENALVAQAPGTLTVQSGEAVADKIAWQKSMRISQPEGYALFEGQTKAEVRSAVLQSESLRLDFTPDRKMRNITANRSVSFANGPGDGWNLRSESAQAVFDATGELAQVIARGKVDVQNPTYTIACDALTLFTEPPQDNTQPRQLKRAIAERNVHVRYREEGGLKADGDRMEWDRATDVCVLTGSPATVTYGDLSRPGKRIEYNRATGKLHGGRGEFGVRTDPF